MIIQYEIFSLSSTCVALYGYFVVFLALMVIFTGSGKTISNFRGLI